MGSSLVPQLAFANSFWESYNALEQPVKADVRKAMAKFQLLTVAGLHADKGLHFESVDKARDPRMRTIRINDFWRGVVLAPDDGSDVVLLVNVVTNDDAYTWAVKRLYTTNKAPRGLDVRNVVALEQLTPALEKAAASAPSLLFAAYSDTGLRDLGIDEKVLRAVRTVIDRPQLEAFGTLLPEDQFEALHISPRGSAWTRSTGMSSPCAARSMPDRIPTRVAPWSSSTPRAASPWSRARTS
ncbi:hypothetical protein [Streptomyces sp. A0642]|uniref:hypothetical protein n=1 Tax=Streptomyces sp. A0642 TaxID=2563100 RepID=UPI001F118AD4|nr:hypothetical protein [Streptomyces sp. A0642]